MKTSYFRIALVIFTLISHLALVITQDSNKDVRKCKCPDYDYLTIDGACSSYYNDYSNYAKDIFIYYENANKQVKKAYYSYADYNYYRRETITTVHSPLICPPVTHKVVMQGIPSILHDGKLKLPNSELPNSEYCIELVETTNRKIEQQYEYCVAYEPFHLCCAPDKIMNDFGECVSHNLDIFPKSYNYKVKNVQCSNEDPFLEPLHGSDVLSMKNIVQKKDSLISLKKVFGYYNETSTQKFCLMAKEINDEIFYFRKYCRCEGVSCIEICCPSEQSYNAETASCETSNAIQYMPKNLLFPSEKIKYIPKSMPCNDTFILDFTGNHHLIMADGTLSPEIGQNIPRHFFCLGLVTMGNLTTSSGLGCLVDKPKTAVYRSCNAETSEEFSSFLNPSYPGFDPTLGSGRCAFRIKVAPSICQLRVDIAEMNLAPPVEGECIDQYLTVQGTIWPLGVSKICGRNANNHFYIEVLDDVEEPYVEISISSKILSKFKWALWVSQINCIEQSTLQAPSGCFQYHWEGIGSVQSFSYSDKQYYSDQSYRICFLSPVNTCNITFETDGDFMLESSDDVLEAPFNASSVSPLFCERDYLTIPRGSASGDINEPSRDRYCGGKFSPTQGSTVSLPISSPITSRIYYVEFFSGKPDEYYNDRHGPGFNLNYKMTACPEETTTNFSSTTMTTERVTLQPPYYLQNIYDP